MEKVIVQFGYTKASGIADTSGACVGRNTGLFIEEINTLIESFGYSIPLIYKRPEQKD